jgi:hypothetical protein
MRLLAMLLIAALAGPATAQTFHDDDCTDDCSGHEAGYEWAEENDITDADDCDGDSQSFNEGCETWVEENATGDEEAIEEGDCEDEDEDRYCD